MVNMNQIMKQAQAMQQKMAELEAEKEQKEFTGTSGGEMVKITLSGKGEVRSVKLDKSIVDQEEVEMLEDLITAAFNEAKKKSDEDSQGSMSDMMGGMKMPPGFKGF
jgi:DNA-binding YbaB/EbfC family protein